MTSWCHHAYDQRNPLWIGFDQAYDRNSYHFGTARPYHQTVAAKHVNTAILWPRGRIAVGTSMPNPWPFRYDTNTKLIIYLHIDKGRYFGQLM